MREFWVWCLQKNILVKVHLLKSADDLADKYTRLGMDKGDYTLEDNLFLHLKSGAFRTLGGDNAPPPLVGHVRQSRECKKQPFLFPFSPLASPESGRSVVPPGGRKVLLCQPPLEFSGSLVESPSGQPSGGLLAGGPTLGFSTVVAPVSSTASAQHSGPGGGALPGHVRRLHGGAHASSSVAPPLSDVIREALERRQISPEGINSYLQQLGALKRYQSAFQKLWEHCGLKNLSAKNFLDLNFSLDQVAENLVLLHGVSVSQARSAYAALLLIPGFDQLRFNPLLCRCKKLWNVSEAKYSHFWSVEIFVQKLAREKLDWANVEAVRNRLILCWRLFALHRSVDLARLYRKISFGGGGV
jgi:hypothetical protein